MKIVVDANTRIRQIAEQYLGDADLWPAILRSSGIRSITDIKPGMDLKIPVNEISAASQALIESLGQIQKANEAGAQIFAPDHIERAIGLHEQAQEGRLQGEWSATRELAAAAFADATTALQMAEEKRDQAAEAIISDRNGDVEGQRPQDISWRDLQLRAILIEEEKVRTLSRSTAQITFRDASQLRLNANSNAVIKVMRFDPLNRREEAQVSLVEGDFYALLTGDNTRKRFNLDIPNVSASISSSNFWVSNDIEGAKFANYDDEALTIASRGEAVTLGRNEGTVVARGERPSGSVALLSPPTLIAPADDAAVYVATPVLTWSAVEDAAGYWLEIAADQRFETILESQFGLGEARYVTDLAPGEYFWRVAALDGFGLPGEKSEGLRFKVLPDNTPPYLKIERPAAGAILREASVEITGEAEPGAAVTVASEPVEPDEDGRFAKTIHPVEGDNTIVIVATDAAGNRTTRERRFRYMPDARSVISFDPSIRQVAPGHFLTNGAGLSLGGRTTPNAEVEVRDGGSVRASATTTEDGNFRLNVPLSADEESLNVAVIAPSGFTTTEPIAVTIDRDPPAITFDEILPRLTAEAALRVAGRAEPDASLTLNGRALRLTDGHFDETVTLAPGDNIIEVIATDAVGNVRVDKSSVKLDQDPPRLVSATARPVGSGGRQVLSITVIADDASGLARAAPFVVATSSGTYTGYLRYNRAAKAYQSIALIPEEEIGEARLSRIELSDDAGNEEIFDIPQQL